MKEKTKLPTIVGILVLVLGVAAGVLLVQYRQIFRIGASPDIVPQDVRITNISDTSFTVSWITDKATVGFVKWGESNQPDKTAAEEESGAKNIHQVTLSNLSSGLTYYFKINSDNEDHDNNGIPYEVKTGPTITPPQSSFVISGNVVTASGQPAAGVMIYVTSGVTSPVSAQTSASGAWIIPINNARTTDLLGRPTLAKTTLLEIYVQGATQGVSTAQVYLQSANPTPQIILGQTYDFKNEQPSDTSGLPGASLNLPDESTTSSKFDVDNTTSGSPSPKPTTVTLESVTPGETIASTKPEFFGGGPAGTEITITVESDPITDTVKIDNTGDWNWTPPTNLEPGTHKVTLKWKDASGVLRTLVRTFEVKASEGPAFVSTPSATPKSSPTATPKASATPKATPKGATPSATPRVSVPVSDGGTPVAGSLTPTIALSIMGVGLLAVAVIAARKSSV